MSASPLVSAAGLTKRFGTFTAVDGIDFRVEPGEAFGMLGPNGAGKSSTMRMIGCVSPPSDGELRVLGMDPAADGPRIRARLGSVPQEDTLDQELTVWDNMLVPNKAEHKTNVETMMNFYYDPVNAAKLSAWNYYFCPVAGAQQEIGQFDKSAVNSDFIFLDDQTLESGYMFMALGDDQETDFQRQFNEVMSG